MTVLFHRLAAREFVAARRRYAQFSPVTEARFVAAVRAAVERIDANPQLGSPFRGPYRWVRTRRYPYLLHYEVIRPDLVRVYAVAHARRRPGYWVRRVNRP
jgi:plasmid stabilization system protein ParE